MDTQPIETNSPDKEHESITDILENEDGSAVVKFDDRPTPPEDNPDFYINLATTLDDSFLGVMGNEIRDLIDLDKDARKERDKQYAEGIKRTGLGNDAPGGAKFRGASKVVHPMMTEACIDFAAKIIMELFPRSAQGPVKDYIQGEVTEEKVEKAKRKTRYMNWQLTQEMPEFRGELEQGLTQAPMGGAFYIKLYWDTPQDRPRPLIITVDDLLLPYTAMSYLGAERVSHRQILTEYEFQRRVRSEMYREIKVMPVQVDPTDAQSANEKVQGNEDPGTALEDGTYEIYEVQCYWELPDDQFPSPYLVTIDYATAQVLSIYRNWEEDDEKRLKLEHIVEFPFQPWWGAYPIGLPHLIGGLSAAATGALRALLDAAHLNNAQAALKLKGGTGRGGQNVVITPGEIKEIEGAVAATDPDIRKVVMPVPANPPSNVLLELLGMLSEAGKGVVRTAYDEMPETSNQMPVGTTLALIEQGMTVFSGIHGRMHDAFGRLLKVLHRLNKLNIQERVVYDETGELMVHRKDFEGALDVIPVSDPNVFSSVQRAAQMQFIAQRQMAVPGLYDPRAVEERLLEDAKIPNPKSLLVARKEPNKLNSVNENIALTLGQPVTAFPDQDHLAHIQVHADYLKSPIFGMNPLIAPVFLPGATKHLVEHMTYFYLSHMFDTLSGSLGMDASVLMKLKDDQIDENFEQLMALASQKVVPECEEALQGVMPLIQAAQQYMQGNQPPPPMDPAAAQIEIAKMDKDTEEKKIQASAATKMEDNKTRLATAQMQTQASAAEKQADVATDEKKLQTDIAKQQMEDNKDLTINQQDNQTALIIAREKIEHDQSTQLQNGNSIGED